MGNCIVSMRVIINADKLFTGFMLILLNYIRKYALKALSHLHFLLDSLKDQNFFLSYLYLS